MYNVYVYALYLYVYLYAFWRDENGVEQFLHFMRPAKKGVGAEAEGENQVVVESLIKKHRIDCSILPATATTTTGGSGTAA